MSNTKFPVLAALALTLLSCAKERFINEPGSLVPKTAEESPAVPTAIINGAKIHTEAFGPADSTLVVFLHGGPGGDYRSLLNGKALADQGYRVVFYDQRGSGLSQRFAKKHYTTLGQGALDELYTDLSGVIAHYRTRPGQRVYLVGHSWGAILATGYAAQYPQHIQGLVVAEPGGLKWNDIKDYVKASRQFGLWSEMLNDAAFLDEFMTGKEDQHAILDYKAAMISAKNEIAGEDNTSPGSFWRQGAVINTALFEIAEKQPIDFTTGLDKFKLPVLFLYSAQNKAYPDSRALKISEAYSSPRRHKISGTGHSGMFSDGVAWNGQTMPRILDYFKSL